MIKDLTKIRELLRDYVEVEMPYDFNKGCDIQYVTCGLDSESNIDINTESFYPNCKFIRRCNDILIVESNGQTKNVQIYRRDKGGNIIYKSRFFILENNTENLNQIGDSQVGGGKSKEDLKDLKDTIEYQQSIIEKLTERVKHVEIEKHEIQEKISTYEELLQEGRYKLKQMSLELKEKTEKLNHYEELIPKLINSR